MKFNNTYHLHGTDDKGNIFIRTNIKAYTSYIIEDKGILTNMNTSTVTYLYYTVYVLYGNTCILKRLKGFGSYIAYFIFTIYT